MLRRTALLCSAALAVAGLSTAPAQAATAPQPKPVRLAGGLTEVLRSDVQLGKAALRRQPSPATRSNVVNSSPAWIVSYDADFNAPANAGAKAAFQAAVNIWHDILLSPVAIRVRASFDPLAQGVLGQAGPTGFEPASELGIGDGTSWYPDALADALAGQDVFPGDDDIEAQFNSNETDIHYGTDGNPASNEIDFESVVLHELGHGLGISSASAVDQKGTPSTLDDTAYFDDSSKRLIFDKFLFNAANQPLFNHNNSRDNLRAFVDPNVNTDPPVNDPYDTPTNRVYFRGTNALNQNYGVKPTLYATNPFLEGSSIAHLDEGNYPTGNANALMTPFLNNGEVVHDPGPLTKAMLRDLGWQTTADLPGKVKNVVAVKHTNSITLSWQAAPNGGAAVTNHVVTYTVNGGAPVSVLTGSGATSFTLATTGHTDSYVFTVAATNSAGIGPSSDAVGPVVATDDATAPTLAFNGSQPSGVIQTTTASFSLTGDDGAGTPAGNLVYKCKLDGGTYTTCSSTPTFTNLSNATHNLSFVVFDEANNVSNILTASFRVDTLPPVVTAVPPSIFTTETLIGMRYSATDPSGISRYDVRYRRGQFNQTLGGYAIFAANTTATVARLNAPAGYTYCFSVRAYDKLNKVSPWSVDRCVATTLDDRALAASTGWTRGTGSPYYARTITSTSQVGRTLTRTSVQARRIALVATTCSTCGTVGVYLNGVLVKTVSLKASTTTYKRIISVVDFGVARGGTVVVKTLNTGRTYIDGVAFNRA